MRLIGQLVAVALVAFAGAQLIGAVGDGGLLTLVIGVATAVLAVAAYTGVVRWTERRRPVEVGAAGAAGALGRGVLVGVGMFAFVIANIALLGGYGVDGVGSVASAAGLVGFMAAAAVTEELMFRGILFRLLEKWAGTWIALVLTAVLFGASHLLNPHASLWGAIAIAVEAGGMLAAAYAATRTLWLPIGLHFGWNFAAAGIFGTEVSGNGTPDGLLRGETSGPLLVSGGEFGPEGSLFAVLAGVVLTVVFLWLVRRRGHLVPRGGRAPGAVTTTLAR